MTLQLTLPDDLQTQMEAAARADGRSLDSLVGEAAARYLAHRDLDNLARKGEEYARAMGYSESDVLRLIEEARSVR